MKTVAKQILCLLLSAVLAFGCAGISALGDENEKTALRIAVLGGVTAEGSAPYDAQALAALFTEAGHMAEVISPEDLAARELFSAEFYDLVMIPTGAAFPYSAVDNFKKFLREGGRLITSGGFAFSDIIYPDANGLIGGLGGMVSGDDMTKPVSVRRTLPASDFKTGVTYTISLDAKFENVVSEKGLAHNSLYIYDAAGSILNWKDFVAVTGGDSDWERKTFTFTVPNNADHIDILLGLYLATGSVCFDNIRITGADGSEIFYDDMENGTDGWMFSGSKESGSFETVEGVPTSSDTVVSLFSESVGTGSCRYDITEAVRGRSSVNVRFSCEYIVSGGKVGARVVCVEGDQQDVTDLFSDSVNANWHDHFFKFTPHTVNGNVYLEFYFEKASGRFTIDEISLTSGGAELFAEHDAEMPRSVSGKLQINTPARENERAYLGSDDPKNLGDVIFYDSSTVAIFDSETTFSGAVRISAAEGQEIFKGDVLLDENGISGYSAIAWTGNNRGRYQPLLYAYDSLGRKVGVAAAAFHAFYSPSNYGLLGSIENWNDYKGVGVGFFGVTDRDLFAPGNAALREGLVKLAETLCRELYICSVSNTYDCYRKGEKPRVSVVIENPDSVTTGCSATVVVTAEDTGEEVFRETQDIKITRHARRTLRYDLGEIGGDDFYYVSVTLESDRGGTDG